MAEKQTYRLGVISDTHGHLPQSVLGVFTGVDAIVHAGDIGGPEILQALSDLAPVHTVRGNMDGGAWGKQLASFEMLDIDSATVYVLHDITQLELDPPSAGIHAVISGHTHRPDIQYKTDVLYLNPGSASFPRHRQPATVAILAVRNGTLNAQIIELAP